MTTSPQESTTVEVFSTIAEKLNSLLLDEKPLKSSNAVNSESLSWLVTEQSEKQFLSARPTTASNAEWNRREGELAERERAVRQRLPQERTANFPSFWPICRHAILVDITSQEGRRIVGNSFFLWKIFIAALGLNVISELVSFFTTGKTISSLEGIAISVLFFVLFPAFVFSSSHLTLYRAMKAESAVGFVLYFVFGVATLLLYAVMAVGIVDGVGGGILGAIRGIQQGFIASAVFSICSAVCFSGLALGNLWIMQSAFRVYRREYCSRTGIPGASESLIASMMLNGRGSGSGGNGNLRRNSSVVEKHAQV